MWRFWKDDRGMSIAEALVIIAVACAAAVIVTGKLIPAVRSTHNTVVDRMGSFMGSGF